MASIEKQIEAMGWLLCRSSQQGPFSTEWRETVHEVLADLRKMKEKPLEN